MGYVTTRDGTRIYYKDWGPADAQSIVFSHGWPLTADAWEDQMFFLAQEGFRCIAHDRRGHGRSDQPWHGNEMDTYADDLADLATALDLREAVHVGHSTGGGEVARYLGRHGTKRVAKAVLISAVTPGMVKSPSNPNGVPIETFDGIRAGVQKDRSAFFKQITPAFYGFNRSEASEPEGVSDSFWLQGMAGSLKGQYDCIKAFSETDFVEDLKRIDVPTLIIHGTDDQIVPVETSAKRAAELISGAILKVYEGSGHGICSIEKDRVNADLLDFIRS